MQWEQIILKNFVFLNIFELMVPIINSKWQIKLYTGFLDNKFKLLHYDYFVIQTYFMGKQICEGQIELS